MRKLKITAGIVWAIAGLVLILALFPNLAGFSKSLAGLPFMKINPNYTGGEISRKYTTGNCTIAVHNPVFDGLLKDRRKGFVQIDWRGELPDYISDTIDYDYDSTPDFLIQIDRKNQKTDLQPVSPWVVDLRISTPVSFGWAARINLRSQE
jgi:hypothetical protein